MLTRDSNSRRQKLWEERLEQIKAFANLHRRLPHTHEAGMLGRWLNAVQTEHRKNQNKDRWDDNKIAALEALPYWTWDNFERLSVKRRAHEIADWYIKHPDRQNITKLDNPDFTFNAYLWIEAHRSYYRKGKLTSEEVDWLEAVPNWQWDGRNRANRSQYEVELSQMLVSEQGLHVTYVAVGESKRWQCDVVIASEKVVIEYDGWWWHQDRELKDKAKTEDLEKGGWSVIRIREQPLEKLRASDLEHDPKNSISVLLPKILMLIKPHGSMGSASIAKINNENFNWLQQEQGSNWSQNFQGVSSYLTQYGEYPPSEYVNNNGYRLMQWIRSQKSLYQSGKLIPSREALLSTLPNWNWETRAMIRLKWDEAYKRVFDYINEHSSPVPAGYRSDDGYSLYAWIVHQRMYKRKEKLSSSTINKLELLPYWDWSPPMFGKNNVKKDF